MYFVDINKHKYEVEFADKSLMKGKINGLTFELDRIDSKNSFHIIYKQKSFSVHLLKIDSENKTVSLEINKKTFEASITTELDKIIKKMGFKTHATEISKNLKAPMPGLVSDIKVNIGDPVLKGDSLIVLEAMKMENSLKAENDSVVKEINVKKGSTVEKNEVLIIFE